MISHFWIETRKPHWDRLQSLTERCGNSGTRNLTRVELREFGLLYRQVAADLSILRNDPTGAHLSRYLNQLLSRAHSIIYTGRKTSIRSILSFFSEEWPQLVWQLRGYIFTATAVFLLCAMAGALLTLFNEDFQLQVLGPQMMETIERHEMWTNSIVAVRPMASSAIMTNNISVCFTTFAMGVTLGIGTLYMIAFNGLLMGVIGAACGTHGMSLSLWSFVVGHGSLELPAIMFAGAAGLRIAAGLLSPGGLARRESLRIAGDESVKLVLGTVPMLIVAGTIEGFISPIAIPPAYKFTLGAALFIGLMAWIWRGKPAATADSSVSLPGIGSAQLQ